ncbi:MAG: prolyl oligopeptidase family serine peptidase [Proteobacteria bacterium]|nr:prolyl oligopeptidase family serine peptidase [Pseudomonadota bacterium]
MKTAELYRSAGAVAWRPAAAVALAVAFAVLPGTRADAAPACSDRGARAPEARCESLAFGGRERTYRLYVPAQRPAKAPVLVVLHGGGGGGASMEALTGGAFNRRADEVGAIIVYPDGVGRGWNDGRHDLRSRATQDAVDDVGYLRALVDALDRGFGVDHDRIFVSGMSNGGMMTLRLACEASDLFTGFVAVAASLGEDLADTCRPAVVRPLALVDGTADPIVPFDGGEVRVLGAGRGRVIGAERTLALFGRRAGCTGSTAAPPLDRVADDGTALVVREATACKDGARLVLYEVDGGGHAWPGGRRYAREWLIGRVSAELDASDAAWRFLGLDAGTPGPR